MTWLQFGTIQSNDFNDLVGTNPNTTSGKLNTVWATGGNNAGYGQTAVGTVAAGQVIAATNWASLINNINSANNHQGAGATNLPAAPTAGSIVTYIGNMSSALGNIYTNRGNAVAQGSTTSNTQTSTNTWTDYANFAFTCTFANGDAARYFFNAGGQLKFTCAHSNTDAGINSAMNGLATATGTIVLSGQNSGSRQIAGASFNGVTKVGGSGTVASIATNSGYFGLTTANTTIFDQDSGTAPYTTTVQVNYVANTTTANVSGNGDNGSTVRVWCVFDKISGNGTLGTGSSCTCTVVPPSTGNIANSWGTITLTGSWTTA